MLLRVGQALKARIEAEPEVGAGKVVLGAPPAASAKLDGPRLGLFLYRVDPCADLRNRPRRLPPPVPGEPAGTEAGLPLELRFLVTAFCPGDETGSAAEHLVLLGGALRALERAGPLVDPSLRDQAPRVSLDPLPTEELNRIWGLFPGIPFQTSVGALASPVWIGLGEARPAAPVVAARFGYGLVEE